MQELSSDRNDLLDLSLELPEEQKVNSVWTVPFCFERIHFSSIDRTFCQPVWLGEQGSEGQIKESENCTVQEMRIFVSRFGRNILIYLKVNFITLLCSDKLFWRSSSWSVFGPNTSALRFKRRVLSTTTQNCGNNGNSFLSAALLKSPQIWFSKLRFCIHL